jgi:hypothetical protein
VQVNDLDDDDVMVDEGDEVSFTLVADINDIDGHFISGSSFTSVVLIGEQASIDAEDSNGDALTDAELSGSATSDVITFISSGVVASNFSTVEAVLVPNSNTTTEDDAGRYVVRFDVRALEDTQYVELSAAIATSTATTTGSGVTFYMENAQDGSAVVTGTTTASLTRVSGGGWSTTTQQLERSTVYSSMQLVSTQSTLMQVASILQPRLRTSSRERPRSITNLG